MKKKILVTGGSGFIGSHLVEKLIKLGHQVKTIIPYNIDNSWGWIDSFEKVLKKNLNVVTGDVCDTSLMLKETKKIDVVFHLAALISIPYSYKSPLSYINTNILGMINLVDHAMFYTKDTNMLVVSKNPRDQKTYEEDTVRIDFMNNKNRF